jgi:hypothetical protein
VKRWHAVLSALLFFIASAARASEDLNGAARELARKTVTFGTRGEPVNVSWRNVSSLGPAELGQARSTFEAVYQDAGGRLSASASTAIRITLSETASQYMLVEEAQNGDDRRVWIAAWKRSGPARLAPPGIALDRKLVWEQDEQILDVAFPGSGMLVLSPTRVTLLARQGNSWEARQFLPINTGKPLPRDPRGHLRLTPGGFQAFLPGATCTGAVDPALTVACQAADEPWVLESGSHAILLANFAATRNYFDGRIVMQTGARRQIAAFYSAAAVEEQGRTFWLTAESDGRVQVLNSAFEPVGSISGWGSDIAGTSARCGSGSQVFATRPGDAGEPDSLQAYALADRAATPLAPPMATTGPVTALWPSGPVAVLAVVHDLISGKYDAYVVTVVCGG